MITVAYFISFLIGFLVLELLCQKTNRFNSLLQISLSLPLGLSVSGLLSYLSFLIFQYYQPIVIIIFNLSFLTVLICLFLKNSSLKNFLKLSLKDLLIFISQWKNIVVLILWGGLLAMIIFFANIHPFGEWDAWALWNLKAKFLTTPNLNWHVLFKELHWHTQPDYPLLLPLIYTWLSSFTTAPIYSIALITAVIFSTNCFILVFAGLTEFFRPRYAVLPATLLGIHPFYSFMSTAQYSDILLAMNLLICLIFIAIFFNKKNTTALIPLGMFLGLLTFTKNEGVVLAGIIIFLTTVFTFIFFPKNKWQNIFRLLYGLMATGWSTLIFKLFFAPPNRDILLYPSSSEFEYFNIAGFKLFALFAFCEYVAVKWVGLWILLTLLMILRLKNFLVQERLIHLLIFICFGIVITYVYLTTTNFPLTWRLENTLARIYFYLSPAAIFTVFYGFWITDPMVLRKSL